MLSARICLRRKKINISTGVNQLESEAHLAAYQSFFARLIIKSSVIGTMQVLSRRLFESRIEYGGIPARFEGF
jgi:hypothetical protein